MEESIQALDELNRRNLEMLLSISPWTLLGGLIFGILGIWIFRKARREGNRKLMWVGVGLGLALSGLAYRWK